jgi:uncharacterized protein (DUF2141 family)
MSSPVSILVKSVSRIVLAVVIMPLVSLGAMADSLVKIEVSGLAEAKGSIYIAVYNSDDTWLGDDTVMASEVVIAEALSDGLVHAELQLPEGEYALSIFHDVNDNGEMDTNWIGLPKEPVALSNNARPKFGPPKYKDAVFTLGAEPVLQEIDMQDL